VGYLILAVRFLTIVSVPGREATGTGALGACLVVADHLFVFPLLLGSILFIGLWKVLTGGIHLDGLAGRVEVGELATLCAPAALIHLRVI
jgi:cobalamin synthase